MTSYSTPPLPYTTPPFPSLYWPFNTNPDEPKYLYSFQDIWRFTLYWTLITVLSSHVIVALWAVLMQFSTAYQRHRYLKSPAGQALTAKNKKLYGANPISDCVMWVWLIPLVYAVFGGLEALLGGSLVGVILGAVYNAGYFRMSTWMPLVWGLVNMLVLVVGSFRIQGGL